MAEGIDKAFLESCLGEGMSLPQIARLCGRTPGTVGYWVKRHGLTANGSLRFRPGRGIERAVLEPLVLRGLPETEIARQLGVSNRTVAYWIEKLELPKPKHVRSGDAAKRLMCGDTSAVRACRIHGMTEFVLDRGRSWRCRRCRQEAVAKRRRKVKRILVAEAGGRCCICGYDRSLAALQFHHVDPATKEFGLAQRGNTVAIERARQEAAKCVLLCANCHSEVEAGEVALPGHDCSS